MASFTLEIEGRPDEVQRLLKAIWKEMEAIGRDNRLPEDRLRYTVDGNWWHYIPQRPFSSLTGKITFSQADIEALGWR